MGLNPVGVTKKKEKPRLFLLFCDWGGYAALFYLGHIPRPLGLRPPRKSGVLSGPTGSLIFNTLQ